MDEFAYCGLSFGDTDDTALYVRGQLAEIENLLNVAGTFVTFIRVLRSSAPQWEVPDPPTLAGPISVNKDHVLSIFPCNDLAEGVRPPVAAASQETRETETP